VDLANNNCPRCCHRYRRHHRIPHFPVNHLWHISNLNSPLLDFEKFDSRSPQNFRLVLGRRLVSLLRLMWSRSTEVVV
jgi:hypothetical protein